jgi:hypothetical protein
LIELPEELRVAEEPFVVEEAYHGGRGRPFDPALRDRCRARTDCLRCVALIAAYDAVMNRAFLDGTGPFG